MRMLTEEMLLDINGGDQASEDAGYVIGRAVKKAWNAIVKWWNGLW